MWQPDERIYIKSHIANSIATLLYGVAVIVICLVPSLLPGIYGLLVDDRVGIIMPYLLFIAVGEAVFSIWYFRFRK